MAPWPVASLGDLCEIRIGRTPSRARREYWNGEVPWLSIADMNQGRYLRATKEKVTDLAVSRALGSPVPQGTVVLSFKLSIGKVGVTQVPMYTNEAIAALPILDSSKLVPEFLYWALGSLDLTHGADRAAMGNTLNKAKLREIPVPIPPIERQWRIVELLDRTDGLRAKRREALEWLGKLTRSLFLSMFGDPVRNPRGWERAAIGQLGQVVTGNTPSRLNLDFYGDHIEWIKSDNIVPRSTYLTRADEGLSVAGLQVARVAEPGSVLVTCIAGSPASIGNAAVANRRVAFNQQINAIHFYDADPLFFYAQLLVGKRLILDQSTGGMKGLVSKSRLEAVSLINPPVSMQRKFAGRIKDLERLKDSYRASLVEMDALFASLRDRAFRGEL